MQLIQHNPSDDTEQHADSHIDQEAQQGHAPGARLPRIALCDKLRVHLRELADCRCGLRFLFIHCVCSSQIRITVGQHEVLLTRAHVPGQ